MNTIRIAACIASPHGVTLYLENGGTTNLPNDAWKTKAIMEHTAPLLAGGQIVELDLDTFSLERKIEDKTAGVISFIKVTMERLEEMLADLEGGQKSHGDPTRPAVAIPMVAGTVKVVAEIEKTELVAVVKTKTGDVMIPGMEKMAKQIEHAALNSSKGFQRFMERIASVAKDRGHTIQELLHFMEKGDLPIANDGSIVAYKVLKTGNNAFVDCRTGNVTQKLGSRVWMKTELVDPSRRTECSTGLHIARRGYLHGFFGDIITLVKVAPEDVIAVPQGEPDKMRAAAYHIVGVLPSSVHGILRSGKPMTSNEEASKMLADVIAGNHVKVLESVQIGSAMGGDVVITKLGATSQPAPVGGKHGQAKALDDGAAHALTPKDIRAMAHKKLADAAPIETKAQRDARKKREKRASAKAAAEKAFKNAKIVKPAEQKNFKPKPKPVAEAPVKFTKATAPIAEMLETKAERDARKKREKRAAEKAAKGG